MFQRSAAAILAASLATAAAGAAPVKKPEAAPAKAADPKAAPGAAPLLPGSGSKEPINITADKLDFLNKENKLIYRGNVVAVQGDTTMKASVLYIDLQKNDVPAAGATPPAAGSAPTAGAAPAAAAAPGAAPAAGAGDIGPGQGSSVKHMEADGPVTLISKDQIGTGDHASYDKAEDKVYLKGHVTLSQGTNVTQGDRLIYDMANGQAQVFCDTPSCRVTSVFTPGSSAPGADAKTPKAEPKKPELKKPELKKSVRKPVASSGAPKSQAAVE